MVRPNYTLRENKRKINRGREFCWKTSTEFGPGFWNDCEKKKYPPFQRDLCSYPFLSQPWKVEHKTYPISHQSENWIVILKREPSPTCRLRYWRLGWIVLGSSFRWKRPEGRRWILPGVPLCRGQRGENCDQSSNCSWIGNLWSICRQRFLVKQLHEVPGICQCSRRGAD